ncbi:MFS transporter [Cohnella soli]|uniref:MFS transporter n=1 Tax=Cohnella soli TaxID=425005 RepID=A0ABW0HLW6_9BACL
MSKDMRKLLIMNTISSIVAIYNGIFINLYIWEHEHSITEVSLYNMSMFVFWGISFLTATKLLSRFSIRLPLAVSAICGAAAFAYLMAFELDNRMLWIALLGLPVGGMFGFSSASQNVSLTLRGRGAEFSAYFSVMMIISQVLAMAVPFAAAQVINGFGYAGSFGLMLSFVALMLGFSAFMPRITLAGATGEPRDPERGKFRFRAAFGYPGSKWILLSILVSGIFLQFQNLFTLLFTFTVTQDKLLIALLNMLYTCCSLLGLLLYRKVKSVDETKWLWFGMSLMAVGFVIVLFREPAALILSNVLTSFGMFFFSTVWNAQQFRFIQHAEPNGRASFLVWRECTLVVTRCVLLGLTLPLKNMGGAGFAFVVSVTIVCVMLIPLFQQRAMRAAGKRRL